MGVECCDKMTKEWTTKYYTEDGATRTLLKTGGELRCSEKYSVPSPDMSPVLLLLFKIRRSHESRQRDGVLTTSKAHFSRQLLHRYSVMVIIIMLASGKFENKLRI